MRLVKILPLVAACLWVPTLPARAQSVAPNVTRFYQSLSYESLANMAPRATAWDLASAAGLDKDTVGKSGNPDPEWILGWVARDFSRASDNSLLMLLAARNRTWTTKCQQESASLRTAFQGISLKHQPELERLEKIDNYYERISGYGKIFRAIRDEVAQVPQAQRRGGGLLPSARRGPSFDVLKTIVAYRKGSNRVFYEHDTKMAAAPLQDVKLDDYESAGRPLSADISFEDQLYCLEAQQGTPSLPPFENNSLRVTEQIRKGVKWPVFFLGGPDLKRKNDELIKAAREDLRLPPAKPVTKVEDIGEFDPAAKEPIITKVAGFVVKSVKESGSERILELFLHKESSFNYDCKIIRFQEKCKMGDRIEEYKVRLTLSEVPPGLEIATGDKVNLFAELEERSLKKGKAKVNLLESFFTMKMKGRHILLVERGGKPVFQFP